MVKPLLLLALASAGVAEHPAPDAAITWSKNYSEARKRSAEEGRPIFAVFHADWCAPCVEMEATTLRDPDVVAALDRFVAVKMDYTPGAAKRFGVVAIPYVLVLDDRGDELVRRLGPFGNMPLVTLLHDVDTGYDGYRKDVVARGDFAASRRVAVYLASLDNRPRALEVLEDGLKGVPESDPGRERAELDVAEARELARDLGGAAKLYEKLAASANDGGVRGKALQCLARVEAKRGRTVEAARARDRLVREFPDLAPASP